jgi:glycosyltransferase involved in cell wall biosynthesis
MEFSVLITVYGADNPKFFKEAMNSIWFTQSLQPSQIVLVQDGPVCREVSSIITCYKKILGEKLTFFELKINAGLAFALNEGFKLVKYSLIARMDSDDISLPDRFQKQIDYITKNDVDIVGGQILEFGKDINDVFSKRLVPLDHDDIVSFMKFRSPFSHPSIMIKKSVYEALDGYDASIFPEDYDFFVRAYFNGFKFANLEDIVLWFRMGEDRSKAIKRRWGCLYAKNEFRLYKKFYNLGFYNTVTFLKVVLFKIPIRLLPFPLYKFIYFKLLR